MRYALPPPGGVQGGGTERHAFGLPTRVTALRAADPRHWVVRPGWLGRGVRRGRGRAVGERRESRFARIAKGDRSLEEHVPAAAPPYTTAGAAPSTAEVAANASTEARSQHGHIAS